MTRKYAARIEKRLKSYGVYKPYVSSETDGRVLIESYPLTATIWPAKTDPDVGPVQGLTVLDCSLPREGQDDLITSQRILMGQDALHRAAEVLRAYHPVAYARAKAQESETMKGGEVIRLA